VKDGSKAARQEPTPKGYHTGLRAAGRVPAATGCALSRKSCPYTRRLHLAARILSMLREETS